MTEGEDVQSEAKELCDAHWKFVRETLDKFANYEEKWSHDDLMEHMEWAFKRAFVHGYKHGKMDR